MPIWVLAGAFFGILTGLILGGRAAFFQPIGIAYSMMLESVIYPYILSSVIVGLGALAPARAWRLFQASWVVYLCLWIAVFATIYLLAAAIPPTPPPIEVTASAGGATLALLRALIPENITAALGHNLVPAIVVFALAFGLALQRISAKASLLEAMEAIRHASLLIWTWVVYLAPLGVFALFASTAGTIAPRMADTLAVYLGLYLIGCFALAFILLPLALSAIAPASARELLAELQPAFVLALVTTLPTTALPLIQGVAERMMLKVGQKSDDGSGASEEAKDITRATISLAYVFASLGNYFTALFVLYAAHHYRVTLDAFQTLLLPVMTLLSCSGSPSTTIEAVKFMSQWLGMPDSTVPLYIEAMTVTRYGQVALSVAAYAVAAIAVPLVYFRRTSWRPARAIAALVIGLLLFAGASLGLRLLSARLFPPPSEASLLAERLDPALTATVDAVTTERTPQSLAPIAGPATLDGIRARGVIRVGYGRDIVPFSYANAKGDLVGFDVSYAYKLAQDLHVRLELVPIDWDSVVAELGTHRFDIVMAGAYVTSARLQDVEVTDSYFESPMALLARTEKAQRYLSYEAIADDPALTLGVLNAAVLLPLAHQLFPKARIVTFDSYDDLLRHPEIDAAFWSLAQARAWASAHPGYSAVHPAGIGAPFIFAYLLPPDAEGLTRFVDLWLSLQARNGFRDAQIAYWIEGEPRASWTPRWNLIDNVIRPALGF
ncbi:MAG TPA: cation:dicarboxylase symporter family transporter [Dongiaceae bacterium]|nr:cation:dicarboxylase symporter family transporter [Dongiaceae bacterium]